VAKRVLGFKRAAVQGQAVGGVADGTGGIEGQVGGSNRTKIMFIKKEGSKQMGKVFFWRGVGPAGLAFPEVASQTYQSKLGRRGRQG